MFTWSDRTRLDVGTSNQWSIVARFETKNVHRYKEGREIEIAVIMRGTLHAGIVVVGGNGENDGVGGHEMLWEVYVWPDCTSHNNILPF